MADLDVEASLSFARDVIAGIEDTPLHAPTPCTDWTLRQLLSHLIHTTSSLGRLVSGEHIDPVALAPDATASEGYGDDPQAAFASSAATALGAFAVPGASERTIATTDGEVPARLLMQMCGLEAVAHGWDVATATGQRRDIPDALAEPALAFTRQLLAQNGRPPTYAAEVTVAPTASTSDRLVALLGRTPSPLR